jgi:hypothetical protein
MVDRAALPAYGVASAASDRSASQILVPLVIGLVALSAIVVILRALRRRRVADAAPSGPEGGTASHG